MSNSIDTTYYFDIYLTGENEESLSSEHDVGYGGMMKDQDKTKEQLIEELTQLRQELAESNREKLDQLGSANEDELPNRIENSREATQSIDLKSLFTDDITTSGSFDIRGDIWATTFGKLTQSLPIPAFLLNRSQRIVAANQASARISAEYERVLDCQFYTLFPDSDFSERAKEIVEEVFSNRRPQITEGILQIANERIWGRLTFRSIRIMDHRFILVLVEDLSAEKKRFHLVQKHKTELLNINEELQQEIVHRKQAEQRLKASLEEKEVLLREIHHRVKNNLAIIDAVLTLQADYASDEAINKLFGEARGRIHSMALAHELLYQSENLSEINVSGYVDNLVDDLIANAAGSGVLVAVKEIEDVSLGLDTAVPLGFFLTELVSNCVKHAFPHRVEGEIRVSLRSVGEKQFELIVSDNGVGMPEDVDFKNPHSLGLELVDTFVRQLRGEVEIRRKEGTEVRIRFKERTHHEP